MDNQEEVTVPDSPKPTAFTIDFGGGKVDSQRHKALVEKFQNRHRRGQSLSKLDDSPTTTCKKHPSTGNLPRKSSFQSEGYFSSDEKSDRRSVRSKRSELTLPLKNVAGDKMTQSFPNGAFNLTTIKSPELELQDVSSPDLVSPYSPNADKPKSAVRRKKLAKQRSSPDVEVRDCEEKFVDGHAFDFDKSDTVSDAGTYTLETDNYTEEQKARMSIDKEFNIEQVSVLKKTEDYIRSLSAKENRLRLPKANGARKEVTFSKREVQVQQKQQPLPSPKSPSIPSPAFAPKNFESKPKLSPIMSPTQNLSITDARPSDKTADKIMYPSPKAKSSISAARDQGCFTSVTSSGAFSRKDRIQHVRQPSLTQSEIQVQTYVDKGQSNVIIVNKSDEESMIQATLNFKVTNLPPAVGGITSPTKIPSPVHNLTRPRSRNSIIDLSDSSLETESFLKPTQNYINSLQKRLSLDSEDSDDGRHLRLNNEHDLMKKSLHVRHNSFDNKNLKTNKLEHFQSKNLQSIDQTFNKFDQYPMQHKIHNSPNNSPIRRSSSFSTKIANVQPKVTNLNVVSKDTNIRNSPVLDRNGSIHRSASTANIKPNLLQIRRASINSDRKNQFADTESSSEDDFEKNLLKKKDLSALTNTRYNRAFSLRRGRLDAEPPRCPNTPEMRRKFQPDRPERAISVDRRPLKSEVPSRYLQNLTKSRPSSERAEMPKPAPRNGTSHIRSLPGKPQVFSRTDSGRFSMRATKPSSAPLQKTSRREATGKKQSGGRSNSSLSSKEMEFQNWKRRKSYDPMKAAAEGKKKELAKKQGQNVMTQSYTENNQSQDCDSSPSHSSSVHRSQSFHGTAALEQLMSSEEEEDDLTLSADEGFSPPTPSPCELSPARGKLRHAWRDRLLH